VGVEGPALQWSSVLRCARSTSGIEVNANDSHYHVQTRAKACNRTILHTVLAVRARADDLGIRTARTNAHPHLARGEDLLQIVRPHDLHSAGAEQSRDRCQQPALHKHQRSIRRGRSSIRSRSFRDLGGALPCRVYLRRRHRNPVAAASLPLSDPTPRPSGG